MLDSLLANLPLSETQTMPKTTYHVVHLPLNGAVQVFRATTRKQVQQIIDHCDALVVERTWAVIDDDVTALPTAILVALYNAARPERPIKKFADRATAEARLKGVCDFLAVEPPAVATVAKVAKIPAAGGKGAPRKEVTQEQLDATIVLRKAGHTWAQVVAELKVPFNFIFRVRPLLKALDPSMVKALGPGSPNYGKGQSSARPRATGTRRNRATAPKEAF